MKLCFVGGGKMAEALIGGLIATNWCAASDLGCVEISEERRAELSARFPGITLAADATSARDDARFSLDDLVVAVKPQHVADVGADINDAARVLSIAAGVRIEALHAAFGDQARIIRSMPNTPALVGKGAAVIAGSANASATDFEWADSILSAVGIVATADEHDLDAVTGLSGSGPAYVFLLAEAMRDAGVAQGLDRATADALTRQTLLGAATLLSHSDEDPAQLRANVTSPGGTTAAAIAVMSDDGLSDIVGRAIAAATARSRELGS